MCRVFRVFDRGVCITGSNCAGPVCSEGAEAGMPRNTDAASTMADAETQRHTELVDRFIAGRPFDLGTPRSPASFWLNHHWTGVDQRD